jgi:DNA-binding transcriptional ArsR family regulator
LSESSNKPSDPIEALGGTALRVYLYLLTAGRPVGVRELQRALGFKSPSTARHHLERLVSLGLAERDTRGYKAIKPQGILAEYVVVSGKMIPRSFFLTGLLLGGSLAYTLLPSSDPRALVILWASTAYSLWHSLKLHRALKTLLRRATEEQ